MNYEPPAVFSPPEFSDDTASLNDSAPSEDIQPTQPVEAQETNLPETTNGADGSTSAQGDLETNVAGSGDVASGPSDARGDLDVGGTFEPSDSAVFKVSEDASSHDMASSTTSSSTTSEEYGRGAHDGRNAILRATELASGREKDEAPGNEKMESEISREACERYIKHKISELVDYSPNNNDSEEDFTKRNLDRVSAGIKGSVKAANSILEGKPVKIGLLMNGTTMIGFGEEDDNGEMVSDVLRTAFSIGVAKYYTAEHPEAFMGMANRIADNNPEYTKDEILESTVFYLADRQKKDSKSPNTAYLIASGLKEIAEGAETAARENFRERTEKQALAEQQLQEVNGIMNGWGASGE